MILYCSYVTKSKKIKNKLNYKENEKREISPVYISDF